MANPQKGEIEFEIGGKTYTYLLGMYGLAKLEERMGGQSWPIVLQQGRQGVEGISFKFWLAAFHCGLLMHHEPISEKQASVLLDELTLVKFIERFNEILKFGFGTSNSEESAFRPISAATNGTGTLSSGLG